jgi:hypothetical protein
MLAQLAASEGVAHGSEELSLLPERARSECARSTAAVESSSLPCLGGFESEKSYEWTRAVEDPRACPVVEGGEQIWRGEEGAADEGWAAWVATSCDGFIEPLASEIFVACSYETAPRRRNVVARLRVMLPGIVPRYIATDVPIPSSRRKLGGEGKQASLEGA